VTIFGAVALAARRAWVGYAEQPAGQCDIACPIAIGEEAIVADAPSLVSSLCLGLNPSVLCKLAKAS
jgi:hypothetical protein